MAEELKAILTAQMAQDENIQAVGMGKNGKTVLFVLDDAPALMAPFADLAEVEVIRCNGFGVGPPYWTEEAGSLAYKQRMRPVPGGVSVAHEEVTAGTVSGYVVDNLSGDLCLLSNHHVLVSPMDAAQVGDNIVQPGPADGGMAPSDVVARLVRWVNIRQENISRFVDCAIAKPVSAEMVDQNIIALGYPHGVVAPWIGQELIKSGRSSETTRGQCVIVEADVKVNYGAFSRTIQRCIITGVPSEPGDSGAMLVDMASHDGVALLFAGGTMSDGTRITVGCRLDLVEQLLNVTVPPPPVQQREFWLDLSHWQGDISSLSDDMTGHYKASTDGLTAFSFSQMVAHGVDGVVLKAAQGKDIIDPNFADYYDKALAVGLQVAAYDYVDPRCSAAEHFTNWRQAVGEREFAFVAMDCEAASGQPVQTITTVIQQFGELLTRQYDRRPWIYTSPGFWNQYVAPWSGWESYPLWVAFWSRIAKWPLLPEAWKNVEDQPVMWQFMVSDFGGELGVSSRQVDLNTMFQSGIELIGAEPPPPPEYVTLMVAIEGQGAVSPGSGQYVKGSTIQLQATPAVGWTFDNWLIDGHRADDNPLFLDMDGDKSVTATFVEAEPGGVATFEYVKGVAQINGQFLRRVPTTVNNSPIGSLSAGMAVDILEIVQDDYGNNWGRLGYDYTRRCPVWAAIKHNGREYIELVMEGD